VLVSDFFPITPKDSKMKHFSISILLLFILLLSGCSTKSAQTKFIKKATSDYNTTETIARFTKALAPKRYTPLHTLDHTPLATAQKMYLKPTLSVDLSNPMIDSKLLDCSPTMAVDLPLRVGVYRALSGAVTLVYTSPEYWSLKHNIKDKNCLELVKIMATDLDQATDAITRPKP
jgi:uncharacterized protein (DUF302 family)